MKLLHIFLATTPRAAVSSQNDRALKTASLYKAYKDPVIIPAKKGGESQLT